MPFGEYENFQDCVEKNKDKESPEGYCAELHKKITGEYPSEYALKGSQRREVVIDLITRYLNEYPEADISLKGIESIIDAWSEWAGSFTECVKKLQGKPGITDVEALCAWLHHEAEGKWPAEKSADIVGGPLAIKTRQKRVVIGPVLVPGEPDHEGEILTAEKIEDVAYDFLENFGYIDFEHTLKNAGKPVLSEILRRPEVFRLPDGSTMSLPAGTWILGVRVTDDNTWENIQKGIYKGFSIMGISRKAYNDLMAAQKTAGHIPLGMTLENGVLRKILFSDLGEDWIGVAVSILEKPSVFKSKFIAIKRAGDIPGGNIWKRILGRLRIYDKEYTVKSNLEEVGEMDEKYIKNLIAEEIKGMLDSIKENPSGENGKEEIEEIKTNITEEITALKGEISEIKKQLSGQDEIINKLGDFMKSATKSRVLLSVAEDTEKDNGPPVIQRDIFGRAINK